MRTLVLSVLALALFVLPADANTILYEYTGKPFTSWTGDVCLGNCALTMLIVTAEPVAPNQVAGFGNLVPISASSFTITDGHTTLANRVRGALWLFSTDAQGLPLEWHFWMEFFGNELTSINCSTVARCLNGNSLALDVLRRVDDPLNGPVTYRARNMDSPGTWRAVSVPEPMSLVLLGLGFVGLIGARRYCGR